MISDFLEQTGSLSRESSMVKAERLSSLVRRLQITIFIFFCRFFFLSFLSLSVPLYERIICTPCHWRAGCFCVLAVMLAVVPELNDVSHLNFVEKPDETPRKLEITFQTLQLIVFRENLPSFFLFFLYNYIIYVYIIVSKYKFQT